MSIPAEQKNKILAAFPADNRAFNIGIDDDRKLLSLLREAFQSSPITDIEILDKMETHKVVDEALLRNSVYNLKELLAWGAIAPYSKAFIDLKIALLEDSTAENIDHLISAILLDSPNMIAKAIQSLSPHAIRFLKEDKIEHVQVIANAVGTLSQGWDAASSNWTSGPLHGRIPDDAQTGDRLRIHNAASTAVNEIFYSWANKPTDHPGTVEPFAQRLLESGASLEHMVYPNNTPGIIRFSTLTRIIINHKEALTEIVKASKKPLPIKFLCEDAHRATIASIEPIIDLMPDASLASPDVELTIKENDNSPHDLLFRWVNDSIPTQQNQRSTEDIATLHRCICKILTKGASPFAKIKSHTGPGWTTILHHAAQHAPAAFAKILEFLVAKNPDLDITNFLDSEGGTLLHCTASSDTPAHVSNARALITFVANQALQIYRAHKTLSKKIQRLRGALRPYISLRCAAIRTPLAPYLSPLGT